MGWENGLHRAKSFGVLRTADSAHEKASLQWPSLFIEFEILEDVVECGPNPIHSICDLPVNTSPMTFFKQFTAKNTHEMEWNGLPSVKQ